jgi:hypothetical protein
MTPPKPRPTQPRDDKGKWRRPHEPGWTRVPVRPPTILPIPPAPGKGK